MAEESYGRHARRDEPDDELEVVDAEVLPVPPGPVIGPVSGYTASGIPTFDAVREKIETRYGASLGSAELDAETPEGRTVAEQYEARHQAASERLAQIRAEMHPDQAPTGDRGKA
ncbi:hypothetical protein BH09ACT8_BH09ACT8_20990 [soil metagenome]